MLYDASPGGAQAVAGLLPVGIYDPHYRDVAQEAVAYLKRYKKPAGEHALDIFDALKARKPDDAEILDSIFASMEETKAGINREYVIRLGSAFAQHQRLKAGIAQAIDALGKNTEEGTASAVAAMSASIKSSVEVFDPGIVFNDPEQSLSFLREESALAMPTGIPALDTYGLGPARKKLHVMAGHYGTGKSWWLVHMAKQALMNRWRVAYVTLEMSAQDVACRLVQSIFSVTQVRGEVIWRKFRKSKRNGELRGLKDITIDDRPSLADDDIEVALTDKMRGLAKRSKIVIKEFPSGQLTIPMLQGYLASLETTGFLPDILIFDYPDLMHHTSSAYHREELIAHYRNLRGIGVERNIAVATAAQLSDEGGKARTATKHHLAEARGIAGEVDVLLTYSQTQPEHEMSLARLFVGKGRGARRDRFSILLSQSYAMGQYVMDSAIMEGKAYWDMFDSEEVE